jgi:hypothetical protein
MRERISCSIPVRYLTPEVMREITHPNDIGSNAGEAIVRLIVTLGQIDVS